MSNAEWWGSKSERSKVLVYIMLDISLGDGGHHGLMVVITDFENHVPSKLKLAGN